MHLLFICPEYPPVPHGGVGTSTQSLARALVAAGHQASVVSLTAAAPAGDEEDGGVLVRRVAPTGQRGPIGMLRDQHRLWGAVRAIDRVQRIDAVEGPELSFWAAPQSLRTPLVVRMNGGHRFFAEAEGRAPRRGRAALEARSFRRATHLLAVSGYVAERTRALAGLGERPIAIVPNGVDVARFAPRDDIPAEPGLIAFVGTYCEKKGLRQLGSAMAAIVEVVPDAHLVGVGRDQAEPSDGRPFSAHVLESAAPAVRDRIALLGPRPNDDVVELLARAEVVVLPSHMEAMPMAWLEAMACGAALVAGRPGPGPEAVEDGVSGLLCDPHDPASIAQATIALLTDPARRRALGAAARTRAVERFSTDVVLAQNLATYDRLLGGA